VRARATAAERHDGRVRSAEAARAVEVAELAQVCGTVDAVAEILGMTTRDVRTVIKAAVEKQPAATGKGVRRRAGQVARPARGDGGNDDDVGYD
jgi:predicted transcriptional regulator